MKVCRGGEDLEPRHRRAVRRSETVPPPGETAPEGAGPGHIFYKESYDLDQRYKMKEIAEFKQQK